MRNVKAVVCSLVLVASVGSAFACVGEDPRPGADIDVGVDSGPTPDGTAGTSDAPATEDAAMPGPASFTVDGDGAARAGIAILVSKNDGSIIDTVVTDGGGKATFVVPPEGATLTALYGEGESLYAISVLGVRPSDAIRLRYDHRPVTPISFTLGAAIPSDPPNGTASFRGSAGSRDECVATAPLSASSVDVPLDRRCLVEDPLAPNAYMTAVVIEALDANGATLGYVHKPSYVYTNIPNMAALGGPWVGTTSYGLTLANVQPGPVQAFGTIIPYASRFRLRDWAVKSSALVVNAGSATVPASTPPTGLADAIEYAAGVFFPASDGNVGASFLIRRAAPAASATLDFKETLPPITGVALDVADPIRPKLSWTSLPTTSAADGATTMLAWKDGNVTTRWSFYAPPSATFVKLPVLPGALSAWAPKGSAVFEKPGVSFIESDTMFDYRDFIKNVEEQRVGVQVGAPFGPPVLSNAYRRMTYFGPSVP